MQRESLRLPQMGLKSLKRSVRSSFFSLIEILIAFALIALFTGVIAFNIRGLLESQKASDQLAKVQNSLRVAEELMLWAGLDIEVKFEKKGEHYLLSLIPLNPPPQSLLSVFPKEPFLLDKLEKIEYQDERRDATFKEAITLSFYKKGYGFPQGILRMSVRGETFSLLFPGYPVPFNIFSKEELSFPINLSEREFLESATLELQEAIK